MGLPSEGSLVVLAAGQLCSAKPWLSWSLPPLESQETLLKCWVVCVLNPESPSMLCFPGFFGSRGEDPSTVSECCKDGLEGSYVLWGQQKGLGLLCWATGKVLGVGELLQPPSASSQHLSDSQL